MRIYDNLLSIERFIINSYILIIALASLYISGTHAAGQNLEKKITRPMSLHELASQSNEELLYRALTAASSDDINEQREEDLYTPLHCAINAGLSENVRAILEYHPDHTLTDISGITPHRLATVHFERTIGIDLLDRKPNLNKVHRCLEACSLSINIKKTKISTQKKIRTQPKLSREIAKWLHICTMVPQEDEAI